MLQKCTPEEIYTTFQNVRGSQRAVSRELGITRHQVKLGLQRAERDLGLRYDMPISGGYISPPPARVMPLPKSGTVKRYILSSVQSNTDAHFDFFQNLLTYAEHIGADLLFAQFTYNKSSYGRNSVKPGSEPTADDRAERWYDPVFDPYICNDHIELAPKLHFVGNVNILPTTKRPLSAYQSHTGLASSIFPHTKIALESVPGTPDDGAKFIYTTGTATKMNYIQKNAGIQAEFHHTYGALIVEVDDEGDWFVRQLNADHNGTFYDIPVADNASASAVKIELGEVKQGSIESVNWGDLHAEVIDTECKALAFDAGGILDTLRPRHQFLHDVLDFRARNHHEIKNCHQMFKRTVEGKQTVREELQRVRDLLHHVHRDWCMSVVVDSNHDNALEKWLRESDYRYDPDNAEFFLECQLDKYRAVRHEVETGEKGYHVVREALKREGIREDILFLSPDDSFVICDEGSGGIECGMHGHLGPNGSRGSAVSLSRMGRKANTGHTHSAQIMDGMYVAGTFTRLRLDYTKGPSSWSHSMIVTFENGKRQVITFYNGKWRA